MRILVVSPFPVERNALRRLLEDDGYELAAVATRDEGLALIATESPDVIIADAQVVGGDGQRFVRDAIDHGHRGRVILMCSREGGCAQSGVACLTKPFEIALLRRCLATPETRVA